VRGTGPLNCPADMGACASGAQDAHGFASAMNVGYIPEVSTLTYEGIFNEHVYHVGELEEERAVATQSFPIVSDGASWLAIFLKSVFDGKPRSATPIDLSVVIDISGSMSGCMTRGSDFAGGREATEDSGNRLQHAIRAVEWLVKEVLRKDDSIAVSTFNHEGHLVQPLTRHGDIDCDLFLEPVRALRCEGGTRLAAGMKTGRELLGMDLSESRNRRILFLTDMGEMDAGELGDLIMQNANDGVYVSIVAMGAEFNSSLTETVSKNRGSNYFCATNDAQMRECLVDDFAFNMFPAAFDIDVSVCSGSLEVAGVYGTPFDTKDVVDLVRKWTPQSNGYYKSCSQNAASHLSLYSHSIRQALPVGVIGNVIDYLEAPVTSITEVNTMFPSRIEDTGAMKGGLILMKLQERSPAAAEQPVQVKVTYKDGTGQAFEQVENVVMPGSMQACLDPHYGAALSKGLLLQQYVEACRNCMSMTNDGSEEESLAERRAVHAALTKSFQQFQACVATSFKEDEKMQEVVKNYNDFVALFSKQFDEDDETPSENRKHYGYPR